ncbi:hypothetical protein PAL_GLEAN10025741 [Pteropus alecto]|uniref:Uncharacterized protein n=1 Tax=Pteropus alecto TaxID=9402 RepID=L5JZK4_PTEAL|nr:hypothetical protein PAL_GLEAN10025741 [Pteropus alecto]
MLQEDSQELKVLATQKWRPGKGWGTMAYISYLEKIGVLEEEARSLKLVLAGKKIP